VSGLKAVLAALHAFLRVSQKPKKNHNRIGQCDDLDDRRLVLRKMALDFMLWRSAVNRRAMA
jgi:hypothetical protein